MHGSVLGSFLHSRPTLRDACVDGERRGYFTMRQSLLVLYGILVLSLASGQEVTAGIFGTIQDSTGAVVANATIQLRNTGTGRVWQTVSDESGNFSVTLLP